MKNLRLLLALAISLCPATALAQITGVTSPSTNLTLRAADDFATRAFQDPWDMNQKTDVGPFLGSNDVGSSNWTGFTFSGGLFSGTTTAPDAQLWLLDTGNPLAVPIGKTGTNFPIDASIYKVLAVRMTTQFAGGTQAQAVTWANTIYDSSPMAHFSNSVSAGTGIYFINLDLTQPGGTSANWTGLQRALRFQPTGRTNEPVTVDWARLVPAGDATSCQLIRWTGQPDADIYLDTDLDTTNGFYGLAQSFASQTNAAATRASAGCPVVPGAFNFYVGALPAGTYRVFVVPVGTTTLTTANGRYSSATWTVNDIPTLKFTSPTDEGSTDDFATSQLGDAWDFDKLADVDSMVNVNNPTITTLNMEAPDGTARPGQRVFLGTSAFAAGGCAAAAGDPQMTMLSQLKRGRDKVIDTNRYRLLTVEFGIPNAPRDVNCGSVARIIWRQKGNLENGIVSDDIIFNQRGGVNLLDKFTVDMKTLNTEPRAATDPANPNWTNGPGGGIEIFRFDPHEFDLPTNFYIKRIKLADFERAKNTFTIRWTYSKSVGTVDLYYDSDAAGFNGTVFAQGIDATLGQFPWTIPSNLPTAPGTPVYVYAVFRDSIAATGNENRVYAPLPIVMDSNFTQRPRAVLSRQALNFGVRANTATTSAPQTVRLTFVGAADTTPCWTISNSNLNFTVSPSSGTGNKTLTVSLVPQTFPGGGTGVATFTVNECPGGSTMLNPGQQFTATYRITFGAAPFGAVDSPADNITGVSGSIGVTGWVVDDIDIAAVRIYRQAVLGETGADALGRIFLGNASRVDDARPDVEAANTTSPFNYRAGWGYLLLTNFLPGLGNGQYLLSVYAADVDGHETLLGQRTINCTNGTATTPFGAIDTPDQGATVSGTLDNFGWVLTRAPFRAYPPFGTVSVVVDGVAIGSPIGWTSRGDLTALFPQSEYPGITNALGVFTFNTALYQDGVHTISWVVFANNGDGAGIGSRYFTTVNGNNNLTLSDTALANLGRRPGDVAGIDASARVRASTGHTAGPAARSVAADPTGLRTVYGRAEQRVVVDASAAGTHRYEAYLVANDTLAPLPAGASFDDQRGVLYWQPGVGYAGDYDFVMVRDGHARIPVRVVLSPEGSRTPVDRLFRGLFAAN